ncbi:MAG: ABC transporter permease, partial [Spirochaetaceae bacterium]|nr:ABC transporter permease [Spirochaetaceae bacterium]
MGSYLARRFLLLIPTVFFITVLVFLLVRFIPGDVVDLMVAEMGSEGSTVNLEYTVDQLNNQLGLNIPAHIQYVRWIKNVFRGDFGNSLWTGKSITRELLATLPISLELG